LQQVVLEDVADRAGLLVEAGAALDAHRLAHRDLNVVDELAIPDRLEDAVGEAQGEQVLDRLLAQVVVDAEDLALDEVVGDLGVELLGAGEVMAERLLDDEPCPARQLVPVPADVLDQRADRRGRHGEVVNAIAAEAALRVKLAERPPQLIRAAGRARVGGHVAHACGEAFPGVRLERIARMLLDALAHAGAKLVVAGCRATDAHHREPVGQESPQRERVERRHQLALREVAAGAVDGDRARLRRPPRRQPLQQRVLGGRHGVSPS
jgi:hypothetical protein